MAKTTCDNNWGKPIAQVKRTTIMSTLEFSIECHSGEMRQPLEGSFSTNRSRCKCARSGISNATRGLGFGSSAVHVVRSSPIRREGSR